MKKIISLLIIFISAFFMISTVFADDMIGCKYELKTSDGQTDTITFYFTKGKGIEDKVVIGSTGKTETFPNNQATTRKFLTNQSIYLDTKEIFGYIFDNSITSCPSNLSFMRFGKGTGIYSDGYILKNYNYYTEAVIEGYITFKEQINPSTPTSTTTTTTTKKAGDSGSTPPSSSTTTTTTKPKDNTSRKNCSKQYVFAINSYLDASNFEGYSVMIQYYMENHKKFAEMTMKKGTEELTKTTMELHPEVNNVVMSDYFANKYGGLKIEVETFDRCDPNANKLIAAKDEKGAETYLFVGVDGKAVENTIDRETQNELETKEEYEENYNKNFDPVVIDVDKTKLSCDKLLGKVLTKIVRTGITIIQIICAILAIVKGMMILIPAVVSHDGDALKKSTKTLAMMGIILALVIIFRPLVRLIGSILGYDVSCILP